MKKEVHCVYNGRVQGIGFRFTAQSLANKLNISGWVRNLRDGRVELLAQGEEQLLKQYLAHIADYFRKYINDVDTAWGDITGEQDSFEVRF